MHLKGSCHCGAVHFGVQSVHPYPFNLCYCSICRKTAGGGGYAINLGADYATLQVSGEENLAVYQAMVKDEGSGSEKQSPLPPTATMQRPATCMTLLRLSSD